MQNKIKFSIVTPSFNQAEFIGRTLRSVKEQQVDFPVEHIVIDGASTDGTLEILKKSGNQIRYVSEPDNGMQDALNKGFSMATGEIVGWINADDFYLPETLKKVAAYFDLHPDCLWLYGNCRIVDRHDREVRKWITAYKKRKSKNFKYKRLLLENFISQPAVFMKRDALKVVGSVDPDLPTAMDYDLWLRFAKIGNPGYIDDYLACFRVHENSISSLSYKEQFEEQYKIHEKYDQNRRLLMVHRMNIRVIVFVYSLMKKMQLTFKTEK